MSLKRQLIIWKNFSLKKAKNSKEFKEFISKLEEDKQPKLFTPEELKIV